MNIDDQLDLAWSLRDIEPQRTRAMLVDFESQSLDTSLQQAKVRVIKTFEHSLEYNFKQLLDTGLTALEILSGSDETLWLSRLHGRLGIAFEALGDLSAARRHLHLQISLAGPDNHPLHLEERFIGHHNLGRHFLNIDDNNLAHENYLACYRLISPDSYLFGYLLVNHAQCLIQRRDYETAQSHAENALQIGLRHKTHRVVQYARPVLSDLAVQQNDLAGAERLLLDTIDYVESVKLPPFQVQIKLSDFYLQLQQGDRARPLLDEVESTMGLDDNKLDATKLYKLKYILHELEQDYKTALEYHKKYHHLKDEVFSIKQNEKTHAEKIATRIETLEHDRNWLRSRNLELQDNVARMQELHQHVKKLSETDALTGLPNRRLLQTIAQNIVDAADRFQASVVLAVLDIDHFKVVNDNFGHQIGDEVLKAFATLINQSVRGGDICSRYGGEEFVILMPNTTLKAGLIGLQRLQKALDDFNWHALHPDVAVTVSIGVVAATAPQSFDDLFAAADQNLYKAKKDGRNRLISSEMSKQEIHS